MTLSLFTNVLFCSAWIVHADLDIFACCIKYYVSWRTEGFFVPGAGASPAQPYFWPSSVGVALTPPSRWPQSQPVLTHGFLLGRPATPSAGRNPSARGNGTRQEGKSHTVQTCTVILDMENQLLLCG